MNNIERETDPPSSQKGILITFNLEIPEVRATLSSLESVSPVPFSVPCVLVMLRSVLRLSPPRSLIQGPCSEFPLWSFRSAPRSLGSSSEDALTPGAFAAGELGPERCEYFTPVSVVTQPGCVGALPASKPGEPFPPPDQPHESSVLATLVEVSGLYPTFLVLDVRLHSWGLLYSFWGLPPSHLTLVWSEDENDVVMFGQGGCLLSRIRLLRKLSAPLLCVN